MTGSSPARSPCARSHDAQRGATAPVHSRSHARPRPPVKVRPVSTADVGALRELRIEALRTCPLAFTADLAQTEARPADAWREHVARATGDGTELIVLAEDGNSGRLVGMAGVYTNPQPKLAH